MFTSVRFKTIVALSFLIAVVSMAVSSAETKILKAVSVKSSPNHSVTTVETKVLTPVLVDQDCTSRDHMADEAWCNGLEPYFTTCKSSGATIGANSMEVLSSPTMAPVVGWFGRYNAGSGALKCPWFVSTFSRAYVKFDVKHVFTSGTVEGIDYAALTWKTKRLVGTQPDACIKTLHEATGIWIRGKTPAVRLFDNLDRIAVKSGYFGIVRQVQRWFDSPQQNFGLMIEPSRNFNVQYSDSKCLESLEDIRLTVKYRVRPSQWPE